MKKLGPGHRVVPCALCGGTATRRIYTKFELPIAKCRRCGLVYANPRGAEADILQRYNRDYFWNEYLPAAGAPDGRIDYEFIDGRNAPMLALIRQHAPNARRLLEVGSGAGLFLKAAERAGWDVAGVELSADGAAFAREHLGLDVREERAEAMSFPAGSFDVVAMMEVIEHLFDPRAVLDAVHRALTPRGLLVITTPNFNALSRHAMGVDWAVVSPLEHMYYFTGRTLGRLLSACGFAVVADRPVLDIPPEFVMNPASTHAPDGWRTRLYRGFVRRYGMELRQWVQRRGLAETLVMIARRSES